MKIKFFVFIVFAFPIFCFSQQAVKDSLLIHFSEISNDSLRFQELRKAARSYKNSNSELHLFVIEHALGATKNKKYIAEFTVEKGVYFKKLGQIESAISHYKNAIEKFRLLRDTIGEYKTIGTLASAYKSQGNYELAIQHLEKAIRYFETKPAYPQGLIFNKNNLGTLYVGLKDWKNADRYFQEVYNHPFTKKNASILSSTLINLTVTNTELGHLDNALDYALAAEKIEKRPRSLANLYNNIGNLHEKIGHYKIAESYYLKSLEKNETLKSKDAIQRAYNNLGNNAIKWKKYEEAERYLLKSNQLLSTTDNINSLRYNYEILTALYTETEDYKKALEYSMEEKLISYSILNVEKQKSIADFDMKKHTEE